MELCLLSELVDAFERGVMRPQRDEYRGLRRGTARDAAWRAAPEMEWKPELDGPSSIETENSGDEYGGFQNFA